MGIAYNPKVITDGLVLALDAGNTKSYPGSGTTWTDLSGNGNNGTLQNGVGYTADNGGALTFDSSNQFLNFSFVNPFSETIIVWVKSTTSNWNQFGWISSSRRQNGHIIHPNQNLKSIDFFIYDGSASITLITSVVPSNITIPHMYAYTTNGSNSHKVYFDGQLVGESTASISRASSPSAQTWEVGKDDTFARYGNGSIYNIIRYNRALTAAEIQQNFNALRGRFGI